MIVADVMRHGQIAATSFVELGVEREPTVGVDHLDIQLDVLLRVPVIVRTRGEDGEFGAFGNVRTAAGEGIARDGSVGSSEVAVRIY